MSDDLKMLGVDGIRRSYDEHYDTMMDVEQDPTGAWIAIQKQTLRIEELEEMLMSATMDGYDMAKNEYRSYIEELEAKLEKAAVALVRIALSDLYSVEANAEDQGAVTLAYAHKSICNLARTTLAELKGQDDE